VSARPGFALVISLLLTLALMMLALGVLAVGTRERTVGSAVVRKARAERAAEAAVVAALRRWSTLAVAGLPVGGERGLPGADGQAATVTRLDSGLYVLRGEGRVPGPGGDVVVAAGLLVRTLPSVAETVPGAITAIERAAIDGGEVSGVGDGTVGTTTDTGGCTAPSPGVVAPAVTVAAAATVDGTPPVDRVAPPAPAAPDPLAPPLADRIADLRPGRVARPRPSAAAGECVPGPANWGSPDPAHPCHGLLPMVYAAGDLTVLGGVGRGVLVVAGDLRLAGGVRFDGVVVVHGHLEISDAIVRGAVKARSVRLREGAVVRDGCAVATAAAAPALDGPFRPAGRWWIPAF
jgi:hypothetical protein